MTKLVKEVSYLAADIDDMDLENPGALIQRIQRLDAIALAVANKHDIDLYN